MTAPGLPPDSVTPDMVSRSRGRYLRVARNAAFGGLERGASTIASVVRVPLLLAWLGAESYGIWLASAGIVGTVQLFRLGIHYAIISLIGAAHGRRNAREARSIICTSFVTYTVLAGVLLAALSLLIDRAPIAWALNVGDAHARDAKTALSISIAAFLLCMPLQIFAAAMTGFQEEYVASRWRTAATVVQVLGLVWLVVAGSDASVTNAALFFSGMEILASACFAVLVLARWKKETRFGPEDWHPPLVITLVTLGFFYLTADVANLLKFSLGTLVISHARGPAAAVPFGLALSLAAMALSLSGIVMSPFWPAYAEAAANADGRWMQTAFLRSTVIATVLGGACAAAAVSAGPDLIHTWTRGAVSADRALFAAIAIWILAQMWLVSSGTLLSGLAKNRGLALLLLAEGALALALAIPLTNRFGGTGTAAALALAAMLVGVSTRPRLLQLATGGMVRYPRFLLLRVSVAAVVAAVCGVGVATALQETSPLVRLLGVAASTFVLYAAIAWWIAIPVAVRAFLRTAIETVSARVLTWPRAVS